MWMCLKQQILIFQLDYNMDVHVFYMSIYDFSE